MKIFFILKILFANMAIRKEIRDMSKEEWNKYKKAFNLFKDKGYLEKISQIHVDLDMYAHKNGRFLPWHRMLLLHVESILQMLTNDPSMAIPYWDWSVDAHDPSKSSIFKDEYWGISECYQVTFPYPHCLVRNTSFAPFYTDVDIKRLVNKKGTYSEFRDILELVPHALVHSNLGGDMTQMFSPNDPVFWHHHSFIDYIWYQKQLKGLKNEYEEKMDIKERLYPFNRQVRDVMDLIKCKVKYKPFKFQKSMSEKSKASEIPLEYIERHRYDEKKLRRYEKFMRGESKKGIFRRIWEYITGRHRMA
ncbi:tyrosinase [Vairimorpha necatrix]|uniref:Tyrosinase n=1 Tax=Vairimorpha necatrix TaxID=6039 RepID=A0AAX4JFT9_9MICR